MNKELKRKWLEALRSGKYTQCCNDYRSLDGRYDVFGVLFDVYDNTQWTKRFFDYYHNNVDEVLALIPKKLANTLCIKSWGNRIKFDKLADWIEKKIPGDE